MAVSAYHVILKKVENQISRHNCIFQPVITTRIYALHNITIALKCMSYINSDLLIPAKKLQPPGQLQYTKWDQRDKRASNVTNVIDSSQIKSTYLATHIFRNLVTHIPFLQFQGYISL